MNIFLCTALCKHDFLRIQYIKEAVEGPLELSEDVSVNIFKQKLDCAPLRALLGRDLLQRCNLPCATHPGHGTLGIAGTFCALYGGI